MREERWSTRGARYFISQRLGRSFLGDRRRQIVFIAASIDWMLLKARLDGAPLPDDFAADNGEFPHPPNPLPALNRQAAA
ncbi:MAG: hypothetical protein AAGB11_15450 [Pseudomonadota bacterium]